MRPRTRYCCGTPHARGWETRAHAVRGWDYWEDEELRFTRHEDRSCERNEELACARSEEWAIAHDEERPAGVTEGNFPRQDESPAGWRGGTAIASAWTHRDTDAGTTRTHKKRTGTRGTGDT